MSSKARRQANRQIDAADLTPERLTSEHIRLARRQAFSLGLRSVAGELKPFENPKAWAEVCCASRLAIVAKVTDLYVA